FHAGEFSGGPSPHLGRTDGLSPSAGGGVATAAARAARLARRVERRGRGRASRGGGAGRPPRLVRACLAPADARSRSSRSQPGDRRDPPTLRLGEPGEPELRPQLPARSAVGGTGGPLHPTLQWWERGPAGLGRAR